MSKRRGEVVAIKDLFAKYKNNLIAPQKTVEMEVVRVVGELFSFTLREDQVVYTVATRTVSLRVPALLRQEILLKEREVITALRLVLGVKNTPLHII